MKKTDFWGEAKAAWYQRALEISNLPTEALKIILPATKDCKTFLDVGAGCGTFSIPLAKAGKTITALDPSPAMLNLLKAGAKKLGLKNIKPVQAAWGERELRPQDVILCANVPYLLKDDSLNFLKKADGLAKKAVFLIEGADPNADKFYYKDLYPLLFNKPFNLRADYLKTYIDLHSLGIFANLNIIEYDFDQPFDDIEDAMAFWKNHLGQLIEEPGNEYDTKLLSYLKGKLEPFNGGLIARFHKKSAIIWWRKRE